MIYELQCQNCLVIGEMDEFIEEFECPQCGGVMLPLTPSEDLSEEGEECKTIAISRDEIDEYRKSLKVAQAVDVGIGGMFTSTTAPTASTKATKSSKSPTKTGPKLKSVEDLTKTVVRKTQSDIGDSLMAADATQKISDVLTGTSTTPISLDDTQIEQPMHVAHLEQQMHGSGYDVRADIESAKREISVYKDEILAEIRRERDELETRWREISYLEEISAKNRTIVMLLVVFVLVLILGAAIYMLFQKDIF